MPDRAAQGIGRMDGAKQVGILSFYVVLALIMTYPLAANLTSGVLGPPGDNFEYLYKLSWFKRALFDLGVSPFFTVDVFYPHGYHLALHEMSLANISLGMPMTVFSGETLSYNVLVLLSFVLSGFGTCLLVTRLTGERLAGLLSGVVYAFASYRMGHLGAGHLNLLGTQWFPFMMLSLEQLLQTRRAQPAVLVGVFFALSALSSWYYAPIVAIFAAAYVLCRRWQGLVTGKLWRLFALSGIVAVVLMAPSTVQTAQQWTQREMVFSLREVDIFSASLGDWLVPNVMHPIWGRLFAGYYANRQDVPEHMIALSWVGMLLAALGLRASSTGRSMHWRRHVSSAYAVLLGLSLTLALGTSLHVGGERVYITVPRWLEKAFTAVMGLLTNRLALHPMPSYYELRMAGAIYVPLPTLLLYLYLPFFDAMRVWTRFGLVSAFALAVLAGMGLSQMIRSLRGGGQRGRRVALVAWVCIALVVVELVAVPYPMGWSRVQAQPVDEWLGQEMGEGAIIQFPLWRAECGPGLYASTVHGKPLAYGYGAFFPQYYRQLRPVLWGFPSAQSIALLRDWGVKYVLVGAEAYGQQWPEVQQRLQEFDTLQLVETFAEEPLYHSGWLAEALPDLHRALLVDEIYVYTLE
jgi:hypothetical protein